MNTHGEKADALSTIEANIGRNTAVVEQAHAEGYAAGELKHGPIALIDENMPVIVIAPHDRIFEKTVSNMQEVAARGGKIILITDQKGAANATVKTLETIVLPDVPEFIAPIVYALPIQTQYTGEPRYVQLLLPFVILTVAPALVAWRRQAVALAVAEVEGGDGHLEGVGADVDHVPDVAPADDWAGAGGAAGEEPPAG